MTTAWEELPQWMLPPRESGWEADDLDSIPSLPRHTELIDGALIFMMSPQSSGHARLVGRLTQRLEEQAPEGFTVDREMTIRIDKKTRPEPDVLVSTVPYDEDRTRYLPEEVVLAVEVVSPESADRDIKLKPGRYAEARIRHFWRIEKETDHVAVHVFELEETTKTYVATGIYRDRLAVSVPFPVNIDLKSLRR
ncbi:Uma2 family endonuclease [Streptomyces sp. NRRL B-1347]|uniref:Uma2 family endonuclease n=1 Tax=Streptomyces sp. NRRL B-1347 TaxID=1476877 RepID=UPI0004CC7C7B|nr:Uma2 family endonuclease [Streptomyces sp. NRRL B-1347]